MYKNLNADNRFIMMYNIFVAYCVTYYLPSLGGALLAFARFQAYFIIGLPLLIIYFLNKYGCKKHIILLYVIVFMIELRTQIVTVLKCYPECFVPYRSILG